MKLARNVFRFSSVLALAALLGVGSAQGMDEPVTHIDQVDLPNQIKHLAPKMESEGGPIDLPTPGQPPPVIVDPSGKRSQGAVFGPLGGGALPGGGVGFAPVDPIEDSERRMRRLIRTLEAD